MKRIVLLFLVSCSVEPEVAVESAAPIAPVEVVPTTVIDAEVWEGKAPEPEPVREAIRPEPFGFPVEDRFADHSDACVTLVRETVPMSWRKAVLDWCNHRSYAASRYTTIVSRVDGSQIHDRDRPTAWMFWVYQANKEVLTPDTCPFHAINRKLKHTKNCVKLRRHWPFKDVHLGERLRREWAAHPHDMERFGARGPHDWNANAYNHIPGCWDPAQLDRFDVNITVTVLRSLEICEEYGCRNKAAIRAHWGRRG